MENMNEYMKYLSFFVWFGLFAVLAWHWCWGLVDGKSMLKFFGILLAVGLGYALFQMVFQATGTTSSGSEMTCDTDSPLYINCGGWPIFVNASFLNIHLTSIAQSVMAGINTFYGYAAGYAQFIAAIILYTKFSKGIWTGEIKQIIFAFGGGAIIYVSLMQSGQIEKSFMGLTMWLFGFAEHHGSYDNAITEAMSNLQNWTDLLGNMKQVIRDQSVFSMQFITSFVGYIVFGLLYFLIKIPMAYFSILNIIMMTMQQFILVTIPIDAIKMALSLNVDPFLIIRKLFSIAMLSLAVVVEFQILDWIPNPPEALSISFAGIALGTYLGLFVSAIVILVIFLIAVIFSTIAIFKAFYAGKESIGQTT